MEITPFTWEIFWFFVEAVGEMEYRGKKHPGMRAFCLKRNEQRTFRIDRILDIKEVSEG